jgi:hypothetical protein
MLKSKPPLLKASAEDSMMSQVEKPFSSISWKELGRSNGKGRLGTTYSPSGRVLGVWDFSIQKGGPHLDAVDGGGQCHVTS